MIKNTLRLLTSVLVFTSLLTGCAQHAYQVRDAQDLFSQGAGLDLARKFNLEVPDVANPAQESHRYYTLAVGTINEAIRDGASDLKNDGLYSTALTIKALALWRLGDTVSAKKAANEVVTLAGQNSKNNRVWPRDLGICKSLPILFKIDDLADQAKEFAAKKPAERTAQTIDTILANIGQTDDDLDRLVSDSTLKGHPFQFYLVQARCEMAYALQEAAAATATFPGSGAQKYYEKYNELRKDSLNKLKNVATDHGLGDGFQDRAKSMHTYYSRILQTLP